MDKKTLKSHLHECLRREVMMSNKPFSWFKTLHKALKCPERRFYFWWRISSYLYNTSKNNHSRFAIRINRNLLRKYGCEIQLGAHIGPGLVISHFQGIVINRCAVIGHSFRIRQNTTIGIGGSAVNEAGKPEIVIGDRVSVGVGSCIISNCIKIGNDVEIGAMSFINKDIPDHCTVFTEKTNRTLLRGENLNLPHCNKTVT